MYKVVIGLEVHCQVDTKTKNFSNAKNEFSLLHNQTVATVDLGLPGVLPVLNKEAVYKALKTAHALNCKHPNEILFDRKHYFYPDLPKGYQITQLAKPFGTDGYLDIMVNGSEKRVLIHQLHLEEDTASLEHRENYSLLDYNRSGMPLMEIVTEPCIESAIEAVTFLEDLRDLFLYCEVSEAKTNKGQMRCDVNISLMKEDAKELGTKVEMKNLNSFASVSAAIEYEIKRQTELLDNGEKVVQETRRIDEDGKTYSMREKVDAIDYKYFAEPNIPPIKIDDELIEKIDKEVPVLKLERIKKYISDYKLAEDTAEVIAKTRKIADYFEELTKTSDNYELVSNFMTTFVLSSLNKLEIEIDDFFITPEMLSKIINFIDEDKISIDHAKKILYKAIDEKQNPVDMIEKEGLSQISDDESLIKYINEVIDENPEQTRQYVEEGNNFVINFFIGKLMQKTNRQANPNRSLELIKEELEKRKN